MFQCVTADKGSGLRAIATLQTSRIVLSSLLRSWTQHAGFNDVESHRSKYERDSGPRYYFMHFIGLVFGMAKLLQVAHISSGRRDGVFCYIFSVMAFIVSGKLTEHPANEPVATIAQSVRFSRDLPLHNIGAASGEQEKMKSPAAHRDGALKA
jgi:hypothetical protein